MRNIAAIRLVVLTCLFFVAAAVWFDVYTLQRRNEVHLEIHFFDVGQGDATFIEAPNGTQVLIDGGKDRLVLRELGSAMGFWDRSIDVVVATHPDSDHIGGLADVLKRYQVGTVVLTENKSDSPAALAFAREVAAEGAEVVYARAGQELILDDEVTLEMLFPDRSVAELESNTSSVVLQLRYEETAFLFTGDAPKNIEAYLVERYGSSLESDVLKVGHHGSKTSTAEAFVATVDSDAAIISAECDNRYGHPHAEVLATLAGIEVLGTCEEGTVTFLSDGVEVWRKK